MALAFWAGARWTLQPQVHTTLLYFHPEPESMAEVFSSLCEASRRNNVGPQGAKSNDVGLTPGPGMERRGGISELLGENWKNSEPSETG